MIIPGQARLPNKEEAAEGKTRPLARPPSRMPEVEPPEGALTASNEVDGQR